MLLSKSQEGTESYGFIGSVAKKLFRIKVSSPPLPPPLPGIGLKNIIKPVKSIPVHTTI